MKEKVSKVSRGIDEKREVDSSEPQTHQTLQDLWRETGLSDEALEQFMAFVPFNPNISLDDSDELLANLQTVQNAIDDRLKEATATLYTKGDTWSSVSSTS